ncbi:MAG: molybdopterin-dependent oxidoreductase [Acidimicrobiia bacterium]
MREEVPSYCRICAAACGIVVTVERGDDQDEQVVSVRGDADHPLSRGYTCSKGRALPAWHHGPGRLDRPEVRGAATKWDDALDDLAAVVRGVQEEHGHDAVGVYVATGIAYDSAGQIGLGGLLGALRSGSFYSAATLDNSPVLLAAEMVAGNSTVAPLWDPHAAGLLVLVGTNPVVSHGYGTTLPDPVRHLRDHRRAGGRVWVLDPRRTETAAQADRHLAVRPRSDVVVLAALAGAVLQDPAARARVEAARSPTMPLLWSTPSPDSTSPPRGRHCRRRGGRSHCALAREIVESQAVALRHQHHHGARQDPRGVAPLGAARRQRLTRRRRGHAYPRAVRSSCTRPPVATHTRRPRGRPDLRVSSGSCRPGRHRRRDRGRPSAPSSSSAGTPRRRAPTRRVEAQLASLGTLAVIDGPHRTVELAACSPRPGSSNADIDMNAYLSTGPGLRARAPSCLRGADRRSMWWILASLVARLGGDPAPDITDEQFLGGVLGAVGRDPEAVFTRGPRFVADDDPVGWLRDTVVHDGRFALAHDVLFERLAHHRPPSAPLVVTPHRQMGWGNSVHYATAAPSRRAVHPDDLVAGSPVQARPGHRARRRHGDDRGRRHRPTGHRGADP